MMRHRGEGVIDKERYGEYRIQCRVNMEWTEHVVEKMFVLILFVFVYNARTFLPM